MTRAQTRWVMARTVFAEACPTGRPAGRPMHAQRHTHPSLTW
jgi:hypothetical protein